MIPIDFSFLRAEWTNDGHDVRRVIHFFRWCCIKAIRIDSHWVVCLAFHMGMKAYAVDRDSERNKTSAAAEKVVGSDVIETGF